MNEPHRARKRFGQNFLHDPGIIERIARAVAPGADEHVVEIGPGKGALTAALFASGCRLDVVELDRDLIPALEAQFGHRPGFALHSADALKFDFAALAAAGEPLRIVGNLPYNISTPLLFHLLRQRDAIADMHFMLQLEVVERLAAGPGSKTYGRLGIMTQYFCRVEPLFSVPPAAFVPQPKVQSAVVRLTPHRALPVPARDIDLLDTVLRRAFGQRRKTLRNGLKGLLDGPALTQLGIDPAARPETLDIGQFVAIANRLADSAEGAQGPAAPE